MRKRVRNVLTELLVLCCAVAGLVPTVHVRADSPGSAGRDVVATENAGLMRAAYPVAVAFPLVNSSVTASEATFRSFIPPTSAGAGLAMQTSTPMEPASSGPWKTAWAWIQKTARSVSVFVVSLPRNIRDFFVSGQVLKILQTATQVINDLAVRWFLPLSALVVPILVRVVPGLSVTPELVAVWIFWIIVVLALLILILTLRPRHNVRKRLPRVSPKTAGQGENAIEFGLVEQGTKLSPPTSLDQLAQPNKKPETPAEQKTAAPPATAGQPSHPRFDSPSVAEISLEPLGFFTGADTVPPAILAVLVVPAVAAAVSAPTVLPLLEFTPSDVEQHVEMALEPFPEPELGPFEQETPVQSVEQESKASSSVLPLDQPMDTEESSVTQEAFQAEESPIPETPVTPQAGSVEEPIPAQEMTAPAHEQVPTGNETGAAADLLSRLLDDEESFQQTVMAAAADAAAPIAPSVPVPANRLAAQPSVFSGNIELDTLLHDGVVADASALTQLFHGGYRNRISKLAVSAKDLQNVPEEMRHVIKLTVVALSPIELSIARDLAMRLEAPGFVGEALLVAKKMGYENYLTTYKNISKNYKDVTIVETVSLKAPEISTESTEDLISFS